MHALSVNDRIGAGKIDVLEDTGGLLFLGGKGEGLHPLIIDDHHLAGQDIPHEFGSHHIQAAAFGGKDIAPLLGFAQAKRAEPLWITSPNELGFRHDGEAVSPLDFLKALDDFFLNGFLAGAGNEVHKDLGINGGLEDGALLLKVGADSRRIGEIAVMGQGNLAPSIIHQQRLGIGQQAGACCGVTHMTDSDGLIFHVWHLMAEHFIHQAHAPGHVHPGAIGDSDTGTFLPAVLQGIQAKISHGRYVFCA